VSLPLAKKGAITLVEFVYNDSATSNTPAANTTLRFNDRAADYVDDDGTWSSAPAMSVKLPDQTGMLDQKPATLVLPVALHAMVDRISSGEPFPPVRVAIYQTIETFAIDGEGSGAAFTRYKMFSGRVSGVTRSAGRATATAKIEVHGWKAWLHGLRLGIPVTPQCQWTLGGRGCEVDLTAVNPGSSGGPHGFLVDRVVDSVDGTAVTLDSPLTNFLPAFGNIYRRGQLRRGDLYIPIRIWTNDTNPDVVLTSKKIPSWWVGQEVDVIPGCDKTKTMCADVYDNEARILALGTKMPNTHPVHEVGEST
jgi:hypothetical protein